MNAQDLLQYWKRRQEQILAGLPSHLRREFNELSVAIRQVETALTASASQSCRDSLPLVTVESVARLAAERSVGPRGASSEQTPAAPDCLRNLPSHNQQQLTHELLRRRVALSERRKDVITLLRSRGPSTRNEIAEALGIPEGSLSALLRGEEFQRCGGGRWKLSGNAGEHFDHAIWSSD